MKTVSLDNFVTKFEKEFEVEFDKKMPNKWLPDVSSIKSDYIKFTLNPLMSCFDGSQNKYNRTINSKLTDNRSFNRTRIKYKKCFKKINKNLRLIYLFYHDLNDNLMGLLVSFELKGMLEEVYYDDLFQEDLSVFSHYSKVFKNDLLFGFTLCVTERIENLFDIMTGMFYTTDIYGDMLNQIIEKTEKELEYLEKRNKYLELDDYKIGG